MNPPLISLPALVALGHLLQKLPADLVGDFSATTEIFQQIFLLLSNRKCSRKGKPVFCDGLPS